MASLALLGLLAAVGATPYAPRIPVAGTATVRPDLESAGLETNLRIHVVDADTAESIPAKVTFLGRDGSDNPLFARGHSRLAHWGAVAYHRAYVSNAEGALSVPAGRYDIWVSRGIEYTLAAARNVLVRPGEPLILEAALRRVVAPPGWISADLHVHTANSADSPVPLEARVHQFAADGVEVLVATDHNHISDIARAVSDVGLERWVSGIAGQEVTTYINGHFGVFPLQRDPTKRRAGAIRIGDPTEMFTAVRARAPGAALVVNHPWGGRLGYFSRGRLDESALIFGRSGFIFGFDAIELVNGYELPFRSLTKHHLQRWFALLKAGFVVTATGNSDSHKLALNQGGYPRNYLRTNGLRSGTAVSQAVIAGHGVLTTGPFIALKVAAVEVGDTVVSTPGAPLQVNIGVYAAPWVDVSRITLWLGGELHRRWTVKPISNPDAGGLRFSASITIAPDSDTFVVATADGDTPLWPVVGERSWDCRRFRFKRRACNRRHLDVWPMAVTNPVLVDVDGNGHYDAIAPVGLVPTTPAFDRTATDLPEGAFE